MSRGTVAQLVVLYVLALVVAVGGYQLVRSLQTVLDQARTYRSNEPSRRELGGAWVLDIDREFAAASKACVGPGDAFAVVAGPNVTTSSFVTRDFLSNYLASELLPARQVPAPRANWILCYGCDRGPFASYSPLWEREGYAVLRRQR